ncbi:MAG: hypothetical protein IPJ74_05620 [Saprospiraceae bacterium]|nr:hypothetical protein [Saprospiraceae bacterium]
MTMYNYSQEPESITVQEGYHQLIITYRWYKLNYFLTLIQGILCLAAFIQLFIESIADRPILEDVKNPIIATFIVMIMIAGGIYFIYIGLAKLLNKTTIEVNPKEILVRIRPLHWKGQKDIVRAAVQQFFIERKTKRYKGHITYTYDVHFITHSGNYYTLIEGLNYNEEAQFIEQKIERYLGIENQPVSMDQTHEESNAEKYFGG